MRKTISCLAILGCFATCARADDAPEPTAQIRHGLRMKLVPPPAPKPPENSDGDPLAGITDKMTEIVGDLGDLKTDRPVQDKQKQVISELDQIIAQLEQQKSKSGNGGGNNPTKPMRDSVIAKGPGGIGELHDPKSGTRNIGNLPPKQREAILQSKTEGFPPGYESLLQSYYQRLAQEKVADDSNPKSTTRPTP